MDSKMEWKSVEDMPITAPKDNPGGRIKILLYSPNFGIRDALLFNHWNDIKVASVSNLHGCAIRDWGATHWMHLPAAPEKSA